MCMFPLKKPFQKSIQGPPSFHQYYSTCQSAKHFEFPFSLLCVNYAYERCWFKKPGKKFHSYSQNNYIKTSSNGFFQNSSLLTWRDTDKRGQLDFQAYSLLNLCANKVANQCHVCNRFLSMCLLAHQKGTELPSDVCLMAYMLCRPLNTYQITDFVAGLDQNQQTGDYMIWVFQLDASIY